MFKRFPINPILLREVRGTMRVSQAFWLLAGFIGLISGPTLLVYASEFVNSPTGVGQQSDLGQTIFLILVMAAILALIFIPTVKAAASIAGERERKTFDLLLTSQLPATTIIFGKMLATWDRRFRVFMIVAIIGSVAYHWTTGPLQPYPWLAAKLLIFAFLIFCGFMIRMKIPPFIDGFKVLASTGPTPESDQKMIDGMAACRPYVLLIWAGVAISALIGVLKPV